MKWAKFTLTFHFSRNVKRKKPTIRKGLRLGLASFKPAKEWRTKKSNFRGISPIAGAVARTAELHGEEVAGKEPEGHVRTYS